MNRRFLSMQGGGTRRGGLTMVELLVTTVLFMGLFLMAWLFFRTGRTTLESTERKLDAIGRTHIRFEHLRHDLECSRFAWVMPEEPNSHPAELPGGSILYADQREYAFCRASGHLHKGGRRLPGVYRDVRFVQEPEFVVGYLLSCDRSQPENTGKPGFRERSTLVSKAFVEPQAEESRERRHVWEDSHRWCIQGGSIHYAFTE